MANLRARIDFVPGDEEEEEMSTVATASVTAAVSAGARANPRGKGNGFSVRRLLEDAVSSVVSATIRQYSRQSNETALCIREVIEVFIFCSLSSLLSLSLIHTYTLLSPPTPPPSLSQDLSKPFRIINFNI